MAKKRVATLVLSIALLLAVTVGGTLAYLTDTDSDVNVMTLGNVKIEQIEQQWNDDQSALEPFDQFKPLYPYVGELGWENTVQANGAYRRFTMANVQDKYVSVKNTGASDAYVRTFIALEMGDYSYDEFNMIGISANAAKGAEFQFDGAWVWTDDFVANIDGHNYNVMVAVHQNPVKPGETTIPSLLQVYLKNTATNETVEKLDGNDNGTYDILVFSEAVQAAGFENAETALDAAFGDITETNHPWVNTVPENAKPIEDFGELEVAVAEGGVYVLENPITVAKNLTVAADTAIYSANDSNVLTFEGTDSKITVNTDTALELYGVQMDAQGEYFFDKDGNIVYDEEARRTTPLLNVGAGAELTVGSGTVIENVVAKGSAVINTNGTDANRATVVLEGATIQNCAGESGTIINVNKASDVYIEDGTLITGNASYNNNNHGIIRVYNAWDAENPSTVTMNGGMISENYYSGNGLIGLYYGKYIMNDGDICNNSWFEDNQKSNGWYPVVYVHSNSQFVMNGGAIYNNAVKNGVINALNSSVDGALTINGGTIKNNPATNNGNKDAMAVVIQEGNYTSLVISKDANVTGTVWCYYDADGQYAGRYSDVKDYPRQ